MTPEGRDFERRNTEIKKKKVGKRLVQNILSSNKKRPMKSIKPFSCYLDTFVTLTSIALGCEIFYVKHPVSQKQKIKIENLVSNYKTVDIN